MMESPIDMTFLRFAILPKLLTSVWARQQAMAFCFKVAKCSKDKLCCDEAPGASNAVPTVGCSAA